MELKTPISESQIAHTSLRRCALVFVVLIGDISLLPDMVSLVSRWRISMLLTMLLPAAAVVHDSPTGACR